MNNIFCRRDDKKNDIWVRANMKINVYHQYGPLRSLLPFRLSQFILYLLSSLPIAAFLASFALTYAPRVKESSWERERERGRTSSKLTKLKSSIYTTSACYDAFKLPGRVAFWLIFFSLHPCAVKRVRHPRFPLSLGGTLYYKKIVSAKVDLSDLSMKDSPRFSTFSSLYYSQFF